MAIRDADLYVEAFKIVKENHGGDHNGFREARKYLLGSFLNEIKLHIQINFVDDPDPDNIVKNVCQSITQAQKQFNAVCYKIDDMKDRQKDFHMLLKKLDPIMYNIWQQGDYSLSSVSDVEKQTFLSEIKKIGSKTMELVKKGVGVN